MPQWSHTASSLWFATAGRLDATSRRCTRTGSSSTGSSGERRCARHTRMSKLALCARNARLARMGRISNQSSPNSGATQCPRRDPVYPGVPELVFVERRLYQPRVPLGHAEASYDCDAHRAGARGLARRGLEVDGDPDVCFGWGCGHGPVLSASSARGRRARMRRSPREGPLHSSEAAGRGQGIERRAYPPCQRAARGPRSRRSGRSAVELADREEVVAGLDGDEIVGFGGERPC